MKTTNTIGKYTAVLFAFFTIATIMPFSVEANYGYGGYYNDRYSYDRQIYDYDYYYPPRVVQPIYVSQPVYYPQPQPVYYPVVYQQPVVRQPIVVQAPTVVSPIYLQTNQTYALNGNASLDIGCFADPISVSANQPTTWRAEVTGGLAPFTYSWTGSDGLTGTQSTILKYYSNSGDKSAIVSVTSADGKSGTRACSNAVAVRPATKYVTRTVVTQPVAQAPAEQPSTQSVSQQPSNTQYSAAALFSLSNVPWGWVAVLVILVLFATVLYLLFNRKKI